MNMTLFSLSIGLIFIVESIQKPKWNVDADEAALGEAAWAVAL